MNLDTLNATELYDEIADLARQHGIGSREDWTNLVDETVQSHLDLGELDPDQPLEGMKDALYARWETYKQLSGKKLEKPLKDVPKTPESE